MKIKQNMKSQEETVKMALDPKLKSDMIGIPFPGSADSEKHLEEVSGVQSVTEISAASGSTVAEGQEVLLHAIEKQLWILNHGVANLRREVGLCRNPDFHLLYERIDALQAEMETQFACVRDTAPDRIQKLEALVQALLEKQDRNDRQLTELTNLLAGYGFEVPQRENGASDGSDHPENEVGTILSESAQYGTDLGTV